MSAHHPPLTCAQFKTILDKLGFQMRAKKSGTSHEDWVCHHDGRFHKVTVDCPKAPFSQDLIGSMARQAGVTKKIIYEIHFGTRQGR
jgi:predicted RNA binding protein YcfA (HicA-like mRNA interferase family)